MNRALLSVLLVLLVSYLLALVSPTVEDMLRPPTGMAALALLVISFGVYQLIPERWA